MADTLSRLLADPTARARLGTAARERAVQNFSWQAITARYDAALQSVLPVSP